VGHALFLWCVGLAQIVETDESIVTSSNQGVSGLGVEPQAGERRGGEELNFWGVRVHDVPNVTGRRHLRVIHEPLVLKV